MKDVKNVKKHLEEHQSCPATRKELVAECDSLSDFSAEDKAWFLKNLPEGNYSSADEVVKA